MRLSVMPDHLQPWAGVLHDSKQAQGMARGMTGAWQDRGRAATAYWGSACRGRHGGKTLSLTVRQELGPFPLQGGGKYL